MENVVYYTNLHDAGKAKTADTHIRFTHGKGYWLAPKATPRVTQEAAATAA